MSILNILDCQGIDQNSPLEEESLLKAAFSCILQGVKLDHIDRGMIRKYLADFILSLESYMLSNKIRNYDELIISEILQEFKAFSDNGDSLFLHKGNNDFTDSSDGLVSFQSYVTFEYWIDKSIPKDSDIRLRMRSPAITSSDIEKIIDFLFTDNNLSDDATVGSPERVLWLTLEKENISSLLAMLSTAGVKGEKSDVAGRIRDLLGLWQIRSTHLIAVKPVKKLGELSKSPNRRVKSPTFLDSRCYERFRHWPCPARIKTEDVNYGRTYDLDPNFRSNSIPNDGVPEIVSESIPVVDVSVPTYVGWVDLPPGSNDVRECHKEYANDISTNASFNDIVIELNNEVFT